MVTHSRATKKCIDDLDNLISAGNDILRSVKRQVRRRRFTDAMGNTSELPPTVTYSLDWAAYVGWCTSCLALAEKLVNADSAIRDRMQCFEGQRRFTEQLIREGIGVLTGLRNSLCAGVLNSLEQSIAASISSDYLSQAKQLLEKGTAGDLDHIAAAVIAGAVLEHHLRQICSRHNPPVPASNDRGEPLPLSLLIDGLKRAGLLNEVLAKHLRAWAGIRNSAAHGRFEEVTSRQVRQMLEGVAGFIADS